MTTTTLNNITTLPSSTFQEELDRLTTLAQLDAVLAELDDAAEAHKSLSALEQNVPLTMMFTEKQTKEVEQPVREINYPAL